MNHLAKKLLMAAFCLLTAQICMAQSAFMLVGKIVTMDEKNRVVNAVGVDQQGMIVAVGSEKHVRSEMKKKKMPYERKELRPGSALLPGFIDPHMHVVAVAIEKSGKVGMLNPCLPEPYNKGNTDCYYTIEEALTKFLGGNNGSPMLGQNLDPSRQPYNNLLSAEAFKAEPAKFIGDMIKGEQVPVVIFDQSGHFGYVNEAAFAALPEGSLPPKFKNGGQWPLKASDLDPSLSSSYTGLLVEPDSFGPMLALFMPPASKLPKEEQEAAIKTVALQGMKAALESWRTAGVTTVVSMAASKSEYEAAKAMAKLCSGATRIGLIVTPDMAMDKKLFPGNQPEQVTCTPSADGCVYPKYLGATGIKTILDGSTQACTAAVQAPNDYTLHSGCFDSGTVLKDLGKDSTDLGNGNGHGRLNFDGAFLNNQLAELWAKGTWRFESHANGNRAMQIALKTYNGLNTTPTQDNQEAKHNRVVIIHATVGDDDATADNESVWAYAGGLIKGVVAGKTQAPLKLAFTHTIGHVPYWGGRFEQVLGNLAAQNVDPFGWDKKYGIPYSMNSDEMVTPSEPLWFVRQAVTRETWTYPNLEAKDSHILGPQHKLSVREALQAVTINPAKEKGLDGKIGSIEANKVADFVLLSDNPLDYACGGKCKPANAISSIQVLDTYLGGKVTTGTCLEPESVHLGLVNE